MNTALANIWIPGSADVTHFSPELALIGTIIAVLVVPLVAGRSSQLIAAIALLGSLVTLLLASSVARRVLSGGYAGFSPEGATPMLLADNFSIFFKLFLMLFLSLVIALWLLGLPTREPEHHEYRPPSAPEFFVLLLTSALGMALMVGTLNLLVMIIAIEMASLPSYAIVGSDKFSRRSAEASLKYVMFGAASAAIMTYGASLLYGCFGTLDIPTIAQMLTTEGSRLGLVAGIGLAATGMGILFKISAVPFHFWCPDVFEGAPIEVTTWLSVASKAAGLGLLLRIVCALAVPGMTEPIITSVAWGIGLLAAITCTVGNLAALRQESVKRLLAYSSIAHAGYMMMAGAVLAQPALGAPNLALGAVISYLFVYLLMNLGAFSVTAMVSWQTGTDHVSAFRGLGRRSPMLALPMAACLFSLVGLPPLAGFAAKWWLLYALGQAAYEQPWLWGLVIVAVVNTAVSLYYYVSIIKAMYLSDDGQPAVDAPIGGLAMVNACAIALLLFGTLLFGRLGAKANFYATNLFTSRVVVQPRQASQVAAPPVADGNTGETPVPQGQTTQGQTTGETPVPQKQAAGEAPVPRVVPVTLSDSRGVHP